MNNIDGNALSQILIMVLGILVFCLVILIAVLAILKIKDVKKRQEKKTNKNINIESNVEKAKNM